MTDVELQALLDDAFDQALVFHEVRIETNGHDLTLVFSDLEVHEVGAGFSPFTTGDEGPDFKIPFG